MLKRIMNHIKTNRGESGKRNVLDAYACFVAGAWLTAAVAAIIVCSIIGSLIWDEWPSIFPALTISAAIMTAIWIVLTIKARRRGYADVCRFRLNVAFLLSLVFALALCSALNLPVTVRYLLIGSLSAAWALVRLRLNRAKIAGPQDDDSEDEHP